MGELLRDKKKKVILYGVRQVALRREAKFFLDDGYEIIGYSDGHYTEDIIDNGCFYPPSMLGEGAVEFDYIILLSYRHETLQTMKRELHLIGVPFRKIIIPWILLDNNSKEQPDIIRDIQQNYHNQTGLIFGLSYSLRGIQEDKLAIPFYDCSFHGTDLYYNYKQLEYFEQHGLLESVKKAFLVFPYYYFNYDQSRSLAEYQRGPIFPYRRMDDWHNYEMTVGTHDYVMGYRMFGKKIADLYGCSKFCGINRDTLTKNKMEELDGRWFNIYQETVNEYRGIFSAFISKLNSRGIEITLIIPPFYMDGIAAKSLEGIETQKELFYSIVNESSAKNHVPVRIYDLLNVYHDKAEYFFDLTHLNYAGAEAFTELINREILAPDGN